MVLTVYRFLLLLWLAYLAVVLALIVGRQLAKRAGATALKRLLGPALAAPLLGLKPRRLVHSFTLPRLAADGVLVVTGS